MKTNFFFKLFLLILLTLFFPFYLFSQNKTSSKNVFTVVLDAGHGGKDTGNRGNNYYEKKIALNIALKVGKLLEKEKKIKVIYTRKTDVFVNLIERANIANRADADLFISIHCDSFEKNKSVYGAGTFVMGLHANDRNFEIAKKENSVIFLEDNYLQNYDGFDPNSLESVIGLTLMQETYLDQSIFAASSIQNSFVKKLKRKNRTVKQAGFIVLKYSYMPSVLVETGFLTNKKEGAYLNSKKGQNEMAQTISEAIKSYFYNLEDTFVNNNLSYENKVTKLSAKGDNIFFKVQIAASKSLLATKSYNFKGLRNISREKKGNIYRYYYGKTAKYKDAINLMKKAKRKGYRKAFVVAFRSGKKIQLKDAIK